MSKNDTLNKVVLDPKAGYTFTVEEHDDMHPGWAKPATGFTVKAWHPSNPDKSVGFARFRHEGRTKLHPEEVSVDKDHRRKGLASAMYAHAEKISGRHVKPSNDQTNAGKALWAGNKKNKQFGKSEDLNKGLAGAVAGAALAMAPMSKPAAPKTTSVQKPVQQQQPAPKESFLDKAKKLVPVYKMKWNPDFLHQELVPIAHLESSFGKFVHHAPSSKGPFFTAVGAVGFKPEVAHEEYSRSKTLQKLYPNLVDQQQFLNKFGSDSKFYNLMASAHWTHMRKLFPNLARAVYSWRWGVGAAHKATPEEIGSDPYVKSYLKLAEDIKKNPHLHKAEGDEVLANDVMPGEPNEVDRLLNDYGKDGHYYKLPDWYNRSREAMWKDAIGKHGLTNDQLRRVYTEELGSQFDRPTGYLKFGQLFGLFQNHVPEELWNQLAVHENPYTRLAATNFVKDPLLLERLIHDPNQNVRESARNSVNLPIDLINKLALSDNLREEERLALAHRASPEVKAQIAHDALHQIAMDPKSWSTWGSDLFLDKALQDAHFPRELQELLLRDNSPLHPGVSHPAQGRLNKYYRAFLQNRSLDHDLSLKEIQNTTDYKRLKVIASALHDKNIPRAYDPAEGSGQYREIADALVNHYINNPQLQEADKEADYRGESTLHKYISNFGNAYTPAEKFEIVKKLQHYPQAMEKFVPDFYHTIPEDQKHEEFARFIANFPKYDESTLGYRAVKVAPRHMIPELLAHPNHEVAVTTLNDMLGQDPAHKAEDKKWFDEALAKENRPVILGNMGEHSLADENQRIYVAKKLADAKDWHRLSNFLGSAFYDSNGNTRKLSLPADLSQSAKENILAERDRDWAQFNAENNKDQMDHDDYDQKLNKFNNRDYERTRALNAIIRRSPDLTTDELNLLFNHPMADDNTRSGIVKHPNANADTFRMANSLKDEPETRDYAWRTLAPRFPEVQRELASDPKWHFLISKNGSDPETLHHVLRHVLSPYDESDTNDYRHRFGDRVLSNLIYNEHLGDKELDDDLAQMMIHHPNEIVKDFAQRNVGEHNPDRLYKDKVKVTTRTARLRRIRDQLESGGKTEYKPNELNSADLAYLKSINAPRLKNGNYSAQGLQQFIDAQPSITFNTDAATYGRHERGRWDPQDQNLPDRFDFHQAQQRHSPELSNVFQLNFTTDQINKMKEAGVYHTFKDMHEATRYSGHPVGPHTLGWVRWTGDPKNGIFVDEVQSDFGQSFVRQAAAQAAREGHDAEEAAREAEKRWPDSHFKTISKILFGDRHPNEVLHEAFQQHLRDQGHIGTRIDTHQPKIKSILSHLRQDEPVPGHFKVTYNDTPQRLDMKPAKYGELPTQTTQEFKGMDTWTGTIRKFEEEAQEWLKKAVDPKDFRGIIRSSHPDGANIVDHTVQMKNIPEDVIRSAHTYKEHILAPNDIKKAKKASLGGVSKKKVYVVPSADLFGGKPVSYMVKPYHEKFGPIFKKYMHANHLGWADMTNQALYHAAGIGHLHQKVHVAEHDIEGQKHPSLVIHLDEHAKPVVNEHTFASMDPNTQWDPQMNEEAGKIAMMDFLTNNMDRHASNMMYYPMGLSNIGGMPKGRLLAIDHGRSFQYVNTPDAFKWQDRRRSPEVDDNLANYIEQQGVSYAMNHPKVRWYEAQKAGNYHQSVDEFSPVINEWWPKVSQNVRGTLKEHLKAIKDPALRDHIWQNFNVRANLLDEMARFGLENYGQQWYHQKVPVLRIGNRKDREDFGIPQFDPTKVDDNES